MNDKPIPKPRCYQIKLSDGSYQEVKARFTAESLTISSTLNGKAISCSFRTGYTEVERKVRVFGKVVRNKSGTPITVKVPLRSVTATMTVNDEKLSAVSCCKPPDIWDAKVGVRMAMRHLLRKASQKGNILDSKEYQDVLKICITKPPKISQIKRVKRLADKNKTTA